MKNSQRGMVPVIILIIVALVVIGGGVYILQKNQSTGETPGENENISSTRETSNFVKYENQQANFSFSYPKIWKVEECENPLRDAVCVLTLDAGKPNDYSMNNNVSVWIGTTTTAYSSQKELSRIRNIIDSNYSTPSGTSGVDSNYRAESDRYTIKNIHTSSGLELLHYQYVGKHTVIENYYYFETKNGKTVFIKTVGENDNEFNESAEFNSMLNSIQIL